MAHTCFSVRRQNRFVVRRQNRRGKGEKDLSFYRIPSSSVSAGESQRESWVFIPKQASKNRPIIIQTKPIPTDFHSISTVETFGCPVWVAPINWFDVSVNIVLYSTGYSKAG